MGLAERFKNKLEYKNIFEKDIIEQKLEENDIKFISKPENIDLKNPTMQAPVAIEVAENSNLIDNEQKSPEENFWENMETELINKIRKTPYWEDFSLQRKTGMIENYLDKKLKIYKDKGLTFSQSKKNYFIETVLVLANNR